MKCVAQVEIDPFCLKVLEKHWSNVTRYTDVRECGKHNLPPADLICGGFPCQPHSLAGKRRGAEDDRDLWPQYRRIVDECRPRWVLAENVPGIRTTILDQVLSDLENMDYTTGTLVVPACAFDAPHRRERIFVVAYSAGTRLAQRKTSGQPYDLLAAEHGNSQRRQWWAVEPNVGRVAYGIPMRMDRIRSLGNAVVPQVVEWLGKQIMEIERNMHDSQR